MPLYDEVEIEDMKWDTVEQCFTYECPCGDLFSITIDELREGEELAKCPSCTLFVHVIYNQDDFLDDSFNSGPYSHLLKQDVDSTIQQSVTA